MKKFWMLKIISFDSLENHNPWSDRMMLFESRELLINWIRFVPNHSSQYMGYDNKLYPKYEITELCVIDKEELVKLIGNRLTPEKVEQVLKRS